MTVYELIDNLRELAEKGHIDDEVRLLCGDENPTKGDGRAIKGAYAIIMHADSEVNGVYIDGTN